MPPVFENFKDWFFYAWNFIGTVLIGPLEEASSVQKTARDGIIPDYAI